MNPVFEQFDLLFLKKIESADVQTGMIVAVNHMDWQHPYEGYVVHRVVEITQIDNKTYVLTKGDNNDYSDDLVVISDVRSIVAGRIPIIGFILTPPVNVILIIGILYVIFRLNTKAKSTSKSEF